MPLPKIMLWKALSLLRKRNELIRVVAGLQPGIILITETWLTPLINFTLSGYTIARADRPVKSGGVLICIHSSINYVNFIPTCTLQHDACFIKLTTPKVIIGVMYAPPGSIRDAEVFDSLTRMGSPFLIGGDWNLKHNFWNNFSENKAGKILYNHINKFPYQIIHPEEFTHQMGRSTPSTIDFFITDFHADFSCIVTDDFDIPHRPVILTVKPPIGTASLESITDWEKYQNLTANYSIKRNRTTVDDIESCIRDLTSFLQTCRKRAATPDLIHVTKNKHLLKDNTVLSLIRHRRALRRRGQLFGAQVVASEIRDITATIRKRISYLRTLEWDRILRAFSHPDPTFWSTFKKISCTDKSRTLPPLLSGSTSITTDADKAEIRAATFAGIHQNAAKLPSSMDSTVEDFSATLQAAVPDNVTAIPVSPEQIFNYIHKMASKMAPGSDGITVSMLKHASRKIVVQIRYIFSFAAAIGYFPNAWKISKLVPILKPGKPRELPPSYRPISLLSILGKL